MNYKNTFYLVLTALFAASVSAEALSKQELQEQLAAKRQELRELVEKITKQQQLIRTNRYEMDTYLEQYIDTEKTLLNKPDRNKLLDILGDFRRNFWEKQEKDLFITDYLNNDPRLTLAKLYYTQNFYERIALLDLVQRWEIVAKEIKTLLEDMDHWVTK